ncbi:MAG: GNAT family N-acetyltransferase [Micrococcales bacterium]|nr:GNAT family N-acetyltransferase [Micrococcales bacterium]MCL2667538.1 GNAT family N-acetyltransferase [Micrococcales bacterium]
MRADLFVRPATEGDEHPITDVQLAAWTTTGLLGDDVIALLDPAAMRESWHNAITAPPGPDYRVLVACDGPRVVGFASVAPQPPSGLILAFEVTPTEQRSGHGSRLLAAVVDHLRTTDATEVATWIVHTDEARTRFFAGAGLAPDGPQRHLTTHEPPQDVTPLTESHWSATI